MAAEALPDSDMNRLVTWMNLAANPGDATFIIQTIQGKEVSFGPDEATIARRHNIRQLLAQKTPEELSSIEQFINGYLHNAEDESYSSADIHE